jgi:hypothetical protein
LFVVTNAPLSDQRLVHGCVSRSITVGTLDRIAPERKTSLRKVMHSTRRSILAGACATRFAAHAPPATAQQTGASPTQLHTPVRQTMLASGFELQLIDGATANHPL